jgi:ABC-type nitrate/sulfonate/bicarbonate transport system ATPase subunit
MRDIVLLDDPISAVDPQVAAQIVQNCFLNLLRSQNRTIVLVTHNLTVLNQTD